ncbi:glycosyltransferase family 32 protein [Devosia albogilva]|uniref:Glycosyltransferase family 32 protein n=1 Tax=Devosia albogilva TaxID=429726 RepID=A0ABW5QGC1_9HYPH
MSIPKIIHFTWKTKTLTKFAQRTWDEWARTHPDWELKLWDDADIRALVAEHYPEHLAVFDGYGSGIFRADAWRFFVLHHEGGIYADLDMLPKGKIDRLCAETACFVGAEPEIHVEENDGRYRGMPFVLCNAFMGSVPGHVFWQRCIDALARCSATSDVVDATGPRFVNGVALCAPREERPDVLLPNLWSPLSGWGTPSPTSDAYAEALEQQFRIIGRGEPALVSHLWRNSWFMPVYYKGPQFWRLPNQIQWWWRGRRNKALASTEFSRPERSYDRQLQVAPFDWPELFVAVDLAAGAEEIAAVLVQSSYPKSKISIGLFGGAPDLVGTMSTALAEAGLGFEVYPAEAEAARRRNAMLDAARGRDCVLLDGRLQSMPEGTLEALVTAGRPVMTLEVVGADGEDRNEATMLYNKDIFKSLYRSGGREGDMQVAAGSTAKPLRDFRYLNVAPVTIVGADVLLVRNEVIAAGVRFPEEAYKAHRGSRAFALAVRDAGFEVAALPNRTVVTSR